MNKEINYIENIFRASSELQAEVPAVKAAQKLAASKLTEIGFPNRKAEDWKYYNFDSVLNKEYQLCPAPVTDGQEFRERISHYVLPETANNYLVTINGNYSEALSSFNSEGLHILNFNKEDALKCDSKANEIVAKHFAAYIHNEDNIFKVINTALMQNGFLLYSDDNYQSTQKLQIIHISNTNSFNQVRSLIHLGKNSKLDLIVNYIGLNNAEYFTNTFVEISMEPNSQLKISKIQDESKAAIRMYNLEAELLRDCKFDFNSYSFGAKSNREDITVDVNGENSEANINGIYVTGEERSSHHKITVNHNVPHCTSTQLFKGLLYDKSKAEFNGVINVARNAQHIEAQQLNKNLLLSNEAHIDTRPQLNIEADDVKCAHGATIGQLSEDEIFYLESRGISREEAATMLTYSFCDEVIKNLELGSAREYASKLAVRNLNEALKKELTGRSTTKQCLN